jgi:murein DD-endopeptidase MepM/ murein hydrolase activator NlpD
MSGGPRKPMDDAEARARLAALAALAAQEASAPTVPVQVKVQGPAATDAATPKTPPPPSKPAASGASRPVQPPPTSAPSNPGSPPRPPRKRRGLFDFSLMLLLAYGVYSKTPVGAVAETAVNVARGQENHPSWFATFTGRETAAATTTATELAEATDQASSALPAAIVEAAATHSVDEDALAALIAVRGSCDESRCGALAPDKLPAFAPGATGFTPVEVLAGALAAAGRDLETTNPELQLAALFTGPWALKLALEQARKSNLTAADDVEVHADFLSPTLRRGALQGVLPVLRIHRLRTLAWPADHRFRITSPFGHRTHPVTGKPSFHNGTDIGTPTGTELRSAHHGFVRRASRDSISGNFIIVDHGLGLQTTYCHMDALGVAEKERVARAGVLGQSGATGRVTGPHLHYILRVADKPIDPESVGKSPSRAAGAGLEVEVPVVPDPKPAKPAKPGDKGTKTTPTGKPGTKPGSEATGDTAAKDDAKTAAETMPPPAAYAPAPAPAPPTPDAGQ